VADDLIARVELRPAGGPPRAVALSLGGDAFPIAVLFGPSGAGKSTLLRCIAGLERPAAGVVRWRDRAWFGAATWVPPQDRDVGFVAQQGALFPHLDVADNVAFGLAALGPAERARRVAEVLDRFDLAGLRRRAPATLSGGERQRVALARAVARRPSLLLLDEPFSALDHPARAALRADLRRWVRALGLPTLLVTHDPAEAMAVGDTLVVLDAGQVRQTGPVGAVFERPCDAATARILGVDTLVAATVLRAGAGTAVVRAGDGELTVSAPEGLAGRVRVCVRAEDVTLRAGNPGAEGNGAPGRVLRVDDEGAFAVVSLDCGFPLVARLPRRALRALGLAAGDAVFAAIDPSAAWAVADG
jgi:molybdate transport system ATP-binding protein